MSCLDRSNDVPHVEAFIGLLDKQAVRNVFCAVIVCLMFKYFSPGQHTG